MRKLLFAAFCCGNILSVSAQATDDGFEYMDLGLSVKWATCNVGAEAPEESGYYFAWGEIAPKSEYSWSTYRYCTDGKGKKFSKYAYRKRQGERDRKTTLDLVDDAAHANWGGNWRMPTNDELAELREGCRFVLEELNGVKGLRAYSKVNNNSIFIPFAGGYSLNELTEVGIVGEYWSSDLEYRADMYNRGSTLAKCSVFPPKDIMQGYAPRFLGMPVRPVWDDSAYNKSQNVSYDDVGFFTMENKPDQFQLKYPLYGLRPMSFVSVNDRDNGGSGKTWANFETEKKYVNKRSITVIMGSF